REGTEVLEVEVQIAKNVSDLAELFAVAGANDEGLGHVCNSVLQYVSFGCLERLLYINKRIVPFDPRVRAPGRRVGCRCGRGCRWRHSRFSSWSLCWAGRKHRRSRRPSARRSLSSRRSISK